MVITPHLIITSIIIIIIIKMEDQLEPPLVRLMHLPQANNNNSMVVVTSRLPVDTPGLLPAIVATPTSNGNNTTEENIGRTMAVVAVGGNQTTMTTGGMAIEGRGIEYPLVVVPIIINNIIIMAEMVVVGGVKGVVVEVTEVVNTTIKDMIVTTTSGVVGVTMTESDTGDEKLTKHQKTHLTHSVLYK